MSILPEDERPSNAVLLGRTSVYPLPDRRSDYGEVLESAQPGVSLRHLFAAMAMQGICGDGIPGSHHRPEETARDAVAYADALLKELAK